MTGIIINNNEYLVNTGTTKIEYSSTGGDTVSYSMWGDDIPFTPVIKEFSFTAGTYNNVHFDAGNYIICAMGSGSTGYVYCAGKSGDLRSGMTGGYLVISGTLAEGNYNLVVADRSAGGSSNYAGTYGANGLATSMTGPNGSVLWVTGGYFNPYQSSTPSGTGIATYASGFTLISRTIRAVGEKSKVYSRGTSSSSASASVQSSTPYTDYNEIIEGSFAYGGGAYGYSDKSSARVSWYSGGPGLITLKKIS